MRVSEMAIDRETEEHRALAREAIAVNSTASLDFTDTHHPTALGNPTEGALLLWLMIRAMITVSCAQRLRL